MRSDNPLNIMSAYIPTITMDLFTHHRHPITNLPPRWPFLHHASPIAWSPPRSFPLIAFTSRYPTALPRDVERHFGVWIGFAVGRTQTNTPNVVSRTRLTWSHSRTRTRFLICRIMSLEFRLLAIFTKSNFFITSHIGDSNCESRFPSWLALPQHSPVR